MLASTQKKPNLSRNWCSILPSAKTLPPNRIYQKKAQSKNRPSDSHIPLARLKSIILDQHSWDPAHNFRVNFSESGRWTVCRTGLILTLVGLAQNAQRTYLLKQLTRRHRCAASCEKATEKRTSKREETDRQMMITTRNLFQLLCRHHTTSRSVCCLVRTLNPKVVQAPNHSHSLTQIDSVFHLLIRLREDVNRRYDVWFCCVVKRKWRKM